MQTQKQPRERQTPPSGAFTHRIREDGESFPVRKVAIPPQILLPLPPWPGLFACDRLTAIDLFCATPKKARDGQPTTPGCSVGVVRTSASNLLLTDRAGYSE
ncbi:hypothetical protein BASA83_013287 [Batrachochytrium salamandrivorans]|nr:hypothetical protein BASA83_013287 [Batrachochytrium salamandrivorans]